MGGVRSVASGAGPPGLSPHAITAGYVTWSRLFSPSGPPFLVCKVGRVLMTQPGAVLGTERSKTAAWRVPQLLSCTSWLALRLCPLTRRAGQCSGNTSEDIAVS